MLSFNNKDDISNMMKYHRTRDMINLLLYFPEISAIKDLAIVKDIDDYNKNHHLLRKYNSERNDSPITKPFMPSIETKGHDFDIKDIFDKIKKLDKDGVIVLFKVIDQAPKRYGRQAAFNVDVIVGQGVFIDAVGKGFDGRELSKGIDCHERYFIPWYDFRKLNINNFKSYRKHIITQAEYEKSRKQRIEFLSSVGYSIEECKNGVPEVYTEIPDVVWTKIINQIIKKLEKRQQEFLNDKISEFVINSNFENNEIHAWQMYTKKRY